MQNQSNPSQSDAQKVRDLVITPLMEIYAKEYSDIIIDAMIEDLSCFSHNTLKLAVKSVRRKCKYLPKIADLIEACENALPAKEYDYSDKTPVKSFYCRGHAEMQNPIQATNILRSSAGQLALEKGCAVDLLTEYEFSGKIEFTKIDVEKQAHERQKLPEQIVLIPENTPLKQVFIDLYEAQTAREKRLYENYYRPENTLVF